MNSERRWEALFPAAPHGAQVHVITHLEGPDGGHDHHQAMVLPSVPVGIHATVTVQVMNFPPPLGPPTDRQRRMQLIHDVLSQAREAGKLGLTTDDQTNTVNALMEALKGEWVEDCNLDHEPELT